MKLRVGFIGQGFIGKHMADDYQARGYNIVRYALEEPYLKNKDLIKNCDIVFIAVPTPTTPEGFDYSIVEQALELVGDKKCAVIKSTILPGTTEKLQDKFPKLFVMHSPEFLREKSAAYDSSNPERNIIGIAKDTPTFKFKGNQVLETMPEAKYSLLTTSVNAECVKYIGNTFLMTKLVFMNIAYDFAQAAGADWEKVKEAVTQDSRIGSSHTQPVHEDGRGAGGHCFVKDFEAFIGYFKDQVEEQDHRLIAVLESLRNKNNHLLASTKKDLDILQGVYGQDIPV